MHAGPAPSMPLARTLALLLCTHTPPTSTCMSGAEQSRAGCHWNCDIKLCPARPIAKKSSSTAAFTRERSYCSRYILSSCHPGRMRNSMVELPSSGKMRVKIMVSDRRITGRSTGGLSASTRTSSILQPILHMLKGGHPINHQIKRCRSTQEEYDGAMQTHFQNLTAPLARAVFFHGSYGVWR